MQKLFRVIIATSMLAFALTGCAPTVDSKTVVLVTHDSFVMSNDLIKQFKKTYGYNLKIAKAGDAGAMVNKLVLTKDNPIGDAVFGIDNTLAGLASSNNLIDGTLSQIDFGDVCFNYDIEWFNSHAISAPTNIDQLIQPSYKGLTVLENPATSSTGMAFLATTVAKYGEAGYQDYWRALKNNGVKVDAGWEDAYYTDFSGSAGHGAYPIVLSYSSSPADEVRDSGQSQTASILTDCYRQTEYAGVLNAAKNPNGARALVQFMNSAEFQKALPEAMYVYPAMPGVELPATWSKFAPKSRTLVGEQLDVVSGRKSWLEAWSKLFE